MDFIFSLVKDLELIEILLKKMWLCMYKEFKSNLVFFEIVF